MGIEAGVAGRRPGAWLPPALLVIGLAALAFAASKSIVERSPFEFGLLYPISRYEQALPLVGLGLAMALAGPRLLLLIGLVFALGLPLGGVVANWIVAAFSAGYDIYDWLLLIGPFCCALTGAALASPGAVRAFLVPPAALLLAVVLGMVVNLTDPMPEEWAFAAGSVLSGIWLVAVPFLLWRRFERPWFRIAARIFGSWLIAIGFMLGALYLIPPPAPAEQAPAGGAPQADSSND